MRVAILEPIEPDTVQLVVVDPLSPVPEWMQITPDGAGRRFLTLPAGHPFEGMPGEYGTGRTLRATARRFLAGQIDQQTAELLIADALAAWSRSTT